MDCYVGWTCQKLKNVSWYGHHFIKWPLQMILRMVLRITDLSSINMDQQSYENKPSNMSVKTATIIVTMLPVMVLYPFLQKYFIKGIMIGSIKG